MPSTTLRPLLVALTLVASAGPLAAQSLGPTTSPAAPGAAPPAPPAPGTPAPAPSAPPSDRLPAVTGSSAPLPATSPPPGSSATSVPLSEARTGGVATPAARTGVELRVSPEDGLTVRTRDDRFSLRLGAVAQFRYQFSNSPEPTQRSYFDTVALRPNLRGHVLVPWMRYLVQPEFAGTSMRLLDLELEAQPHEAIGIRAGQFVTPFSRAYITPLPKLVFPDFSVANVYFRAGRDTGAMLFGTPWRGVLDYSVGVFNGNGIDQGGNDDREMLYLGRVAVAPLGRVAYDETVALAGPQPFRIALGFNGYLGEVTRKAMHADPMTSLPVTETLGVDHNETLGVDLVLRYGTFALQGEFYYRWSQLLDGTRRNATGGYVHASWFALWPYIEIAARGSLVDPDTAVGSDLLRVLEGAVNLYGLGNHLKLQLRYAYSVNGLAMGAIAAGTSVHSGTVQTQVFF